MNDELDAEEVELCEAQAAAMAQQMKAALPAHLATEATDAVLTAAAGMMAGAFVGMVKYMHENFAPSTKANREWMERMMKGKAP